MPIQKLIVVNTKNQEDNNMCFEFDSHSALHHWMTQGGYIKDNPISVSLEDLKELKEILDEVLDNYNMIGYGDSDWEEFEEVCRDLYHNSFFEPFGSDDYSENYVKCVNQEINIVNKIIQDNKGVRNTTIVCRYIY